MTWVRTNRRAPGEHPDDYRAKRIPGPWHTEHEHGQTWCGKHPGRLVSSDRRTTPPPEGDRLCSTCERAKTENKPRPYRR